MPTGGAGVNPLSSFQLKHVGINIDITPRVTLEGDIILDLIVESSSRGSDVNVAGTNYPSFGTRKVTTRLRLRDGESNLLAGLLREDERKSLNGFPGAIHVPILKQLFSNNDQHDRTDRHRDAADAAHRAHARRSPRRICAPIYIGSQQNLGVGGPPPLIAPPAGAAAPRRAAAARHAGARPHGARAPGARTGDRDAAGHVAGARHGASCPTQPRTAAAGTPPTVPRRRPRRTAGRPVDAASRRRRPVRRRRQRERRPSSPGIGAAQVIVTPPGTTFRVGGGPYTVPISIIERVAAVDDHADADVRSGAAARAQRAGGQLHAQPAASTRTLHAAGRATGRVDITIVARGRRDRRVGHRPARARCCSTRSRRAARRSR